MRQKLNQIHKSIRKQLKQEYFRQRRKELLLYRQKQALQTVNHTSEQSTSIDKYGWRGIVLGRCEPMDLQSTQQTQESLKCNIDFQINVQTLEDGEYYLNTILQQASLRCFEATIYLLGKLVSKILRPIRRLSFFQQKNQTNLVYMILTHTHNLLQANINRQINPRRTGRNKKYLLNLFAEDYKMLLKMEDSIIVGQLINISYLVCNSYKILPNYELITYLLLRVTTKQNLQNFAQNTDTIKQKLFNLLMNFIVLYKVQERSHNKQLNIPYKQILYDFNAYIEFNLINLYDFIRNNDHPFEFEFVNDSLSYIFTLQIQIICKFKQLALDSLRQYEQGDYLIRQSLIVLLEKIILAHQQTAAFSNQFDQAAIVLQQTATVIFYYLLDAESQIRQILEKKTCFQSDYEAFEALSNKNNKLVSMIILIKVKFRQISLSFNQL